MRCIKTLGHLHSQCARHRAVTNASGLPTALGDLHKWRLSADGALEHESGRFFRVIGANTAPEYLTAGPHEHPMLDQPEIGMLCLFLTEINNEPYGLIAFKFEPGTPEGIEVAPSFQATKSNYEGAHGGSAVPGQEIAFSDRHPTLADAVQREQEAWFLGKVNRNRVIMIPTDDAEPLNRLIPDSYWVPLRILLQGLLVDNLLNMDLRSILSMIAVDNTLGPVLTSQQIRSTAESIRSRLGKPLSTQSRSLLELPGWTYNSSLVGPSSNSATIVGRRVRVETREVAEWDQPFLSPGSKAQCTLAARRDETGRSWEIALIPRRRLGSTRGSTLEATIQRHHRTHGDGEHLSEDRLHELVSAADKVVSAEHAEEGGRFYHAQTQYQVVLLGRTELRATTERWQWTHLDVANALIADGDCLSVEARTCIAMLTAAIAPTGGDHK